MADICRPPAGSDSCIHLADHSCPLLLCCSASLALKGPLSQKSRRRFSFGTMALPLQPPSALLTYQQLAVGGDVHAQPQLQAHKRLVFTQHPCQLLLDLLWGTFQHVQLGPGILEGTVSSLLGVSHGRLQHCGMTSRDCQNVEDNLSRSGSDG